MLGLAKTLGLESLLCLLCLLSGVMVLNRRVSDAHEHRLLLSVAGKRVALLVGFHH